ncbi:MAG: hypothetical protein K8S87_08865 [Planctomycetes bacterium]|nr:hypothetical protein [Planctomycetota bacterium]
MPELIFIMFVVFAGVLTFTSIQATVNTNVKHSFVFFALTFLCVSICLFLLGFYFTSFSMLFVMFINQYVFKFLSAKNHKQDSLSGETIQHAEGIVSEQNNIQKNKEIDVESDKQALNLLISVIIFILLSGFTLYLCISDFEPINNHETHAEQNLNILWFAIFAAILAIIYLLINLFTNSHSEPEQPC